MEDYEENTFDPNKNVMEIGWKMFSYKKSSDDATQVGLKTFDVCK